MARILRTRGRKILFALLVLGFGAWRVVKYLDTLPKIAALGPNVTVDIVEEIDGVGQAVSADGRYIAVTEMGLKPFCSKDGGRWEELQGLPENDRAFVQFVTNNGTVFGIAQVRARSIGFERQADGEVILDEDSAVVSGTPDGGTRVVHRINAPSKEVKIVRGGAETPLTGLPFGTGITQGSLISSDGRIVCSTAAHTKLMAAIWTDGVLRTVSDPEGVTPRALSSNGKFWVGLVGKNLVRFEGPKAERIWSPETQSMSGMAAVIEWIRLVFGGRPRSATGGGFELLHVKFIADSGDWALGELQLHSAGAYKSSPIAWSKSAGWVPLADEIARRGGEIPVGWELAGLADVSADGQTIVGGAKKGKRNAPFVIRFRK